MEVYGEDYYIYSDTWLYTHEKNTYWRVKTICRNW
jgi:hypothetical protein